MSDEDDRALLVRMGLAGASGRPLWAHLCDGGITRIPRPQIQIMGGGAHAAHRVEVQDFMVYPVLAARIVDALTDVTDVYREVHAARASGAAVIVSARSGETEDVSVAHLAVGWGAGIVNVGSMTRSERTAKWNELIRIDEACGGLPLAPALLPRKDGR